MARRVLAPHERPRHVPLPDCCWRCELTAGRKVATLPGRAVCEGCAARLDRASTAARERNSDRREAA